MDIEANDHIGDRKQSRALHQDWDMISSPKHWGDFKKQFERGYVAFWKRRGLPVPEEKGWAGLEVSERKIRAGEKMEREQE